MRSVVSRDLTLSEIAPSWTVAASAAKVHRWVWLNSPVIILQVAIDYITTYVDTFSEQINVRCNRLSFPLRMRWTHRTTRLFSSRSWKELHLILNRWLVHTCTWTHFANYFEMSVVWNLDSDDLSWQCRVTNSLSLTYSILQEDMSWEWTIQAHYIKLNYWSGFLKPCHFLILWQEINPLVYRSFTRIS